MWPEDIKCPIVVGLAGRDRIVPNKPLRRYLLSHGAFAAKSSAPATNITSNSASKGGGGGGGLGARAGFSMLNGKSRCRVHKCNVASHGHAPSFGSLPSAANGGGTRVVGKGGRHTAAVAAAGWGSGAKNSSDTDGVGGGGAAKKVELVYWAEASHGNVLGDPKALDDFVRVATRQEEVFLAS